MLFRTIFIQIALHTFPGSRTFYQQRDSRKITGHVLKAVTVPSQTEWAIICQMHRLCLAFSLAQDMSCVIGSSEDEAHTTEISDVLYFTLKPS